MKKNSLNTAVAALLATGLVVLGVAGPANAETVEPTITPDASNSTAGELGLGAEDQLPAEAPTEAEDVPAEDVPAEAPVEDVPTEAPAEETPVEAPVTPAPAVEDPTTPVTDAPVEETPTAPVEDVPADAEVVIPSAPDFSVTKVESDAVTVNLTAAPSDVPNAENPTSYNLTISLGGAVVGSVTLGAPGDYTFAGLTADTQYVITANASNSAGASESVSSDVTTAKATAAEAPGTTRIGSITVTKNGAVIPVSSDPRGPVTGYSVTVTPESGGNGITQTAATATTFTFSGLASGLYSVSAKTEGPGGSTGVSGYYFFIPEAPSAVTASIVDSGVDYLIGAIKANRSTPVTGGPLAQSPLTYAITITGGGIEKVYNTTDNGTETGGRFYFGELQADTKYTVTIVAQNAAGSQVVTLEASTTKVIVEPVTPVAPAPEVLVDDTRGGVQVTPETTAGSTVTVTVDKALAGQTVHGWLFSTPTDLGEAVVNADGTVNFTIPGEVPAGDHRLAVMSTNNVLLGWGNISVAAVDNGETPGTPTLPTLPGTDIGTAATDNGSVVAADNATAATARNAADRLAQTGTEAPTGLGLFGLLAIIAGAGAILIRRKVAANAA